MLERIKQDVLRAAMKNPDGPGNKMKSMTNLSKDEGDEIKQEAHDVAYKGERNVH